jgi:hypothetical protein
MAAKKPGSFLDDWLSKRKAGAVTQPQAPYAAKRPLAAQSTTPNSLAPQAASGQPQRPIQQPAASPAPAQQQQAQKPQIINPHAGGNIQYSSATSAQQAKNNAPSGKDFDEKAASSVADQLKAKTDGEVALRNNQGGAHSEDTIVIDQEGNFKQRNPQN